MIFCIICWNTLYMLNNPNGFLILSLDQKNPIPPKYLRHNHLECLFVAVAKMNTFELAK
jgi:hypothetical protein